MQRVILKELIPRHPDILVWEAKEAWQRYQIVEKHQESNSKGEAVLSADGILNLP